MAILGQDGGNYDGVDADQNGGSGSIEVKGTVEISIELVFVEQKAVALFLG